MIEFNQAMKRRQKRRKTNFLLDNSSYQKIHLLIYLGTVLFIFIMYLISVTFFDESPAVLFIGFFSFLLGVAMIFYRGRIAEHISKKMYDRKIQRNKRRNKDNLKSTIRNITPKRSSVKLKIKGSLSIQERINKIKSLFKKKDTQKKGPEYIEIK